MKTFLISALSLLVLGHGPVDEASDKQEVAAVIHDAVEELLGVLHNKELSRGVKRETSMRIIEPLIDFELLAKLSLGKKHWTEIDAGQRESFTDLFVETLKFSYFEKLELFTDEAVEYEAPSTIGKRKYSVLTYILSKGERIKLSYLVALRKNGWRVFDFEIEGVSIRKSYGSQYNDFLAEKSFDQLLVTMREKVDAARAKDAELDLEGEE